MVFSALALLPLLGAQHRKGTTGGGDLLSHRSAGEVNRHVESLGEVAIAEKLNSVAAALHQTGSTEAVLVNSSTGFKEGLELAQVNDGDVGLEAGVVEALLRQTTVKGHLTTYETGADGAAGTSLLALVALAAGLAQAGAFTATEALLAMLGTRVRLEIVESQHDS